MKLPLLIGIGAAAGAIARYVMGLWLPFTCQKFAWGTFIVNMIGCLLIGYLLVKLPQPWLRAMLVIGFLGSFTTFSGFGNELVQYLQAAQYKWAIIYAALSVVCGTMLVAAGYWLARI